MKWRWFASSQVRQAGAQRKLVQKLLAAQRDLLEGEAIEALEKSVENLEREIKTGQGGETLRQQMLAVNAVANQWLRPYPNASVRELFEVLLVALAVALAVRTFFFQPFKIPTGSMQPTLYGITSEALPDEVKMPGRLNALFQYWIYGISYFDIKASESGRLEQVNPPVRVALFNLKQAYRFNGRWHTVWFPPDELFQRAGLAIDPTGLVLDSPDYTNRQTILRRKVMAGDHLFVDRLSYNFRHPKRGEIVVFATEGVGNRFRQLQPDQFFIKRLVALGGETVQIGDDRHLIIDGQRLDSSTPHFEKVYSFNPKQIPHDSEYSGHANGHWMPDPELNVPLFRNRQSSYTVRPHHLMVMGDNTMNSQDSRVWGDFSETNLIGKYLFVYWPFSPRFGLSVK